MQVLFIINIFPRINKIAMQISNKDITFRDNTSNQLNIFESKDKNAPVVLLYPAMGVRASYYKHFANHLSSLGINCITVDWRGYGKSNIRPSRKIDHGFQVLIDDMNEVIDLTQKIFPNSSIYLTGHSLGGQIGSLYSGRYHDKIKGLILIAAGTPYYKVWEEFGAWKLKIGGRIFYPVSKLFGYYPGNLIGFGGREARGVIKDWSYIALKGRYILSGSSFDYEKAMNESELNILSISIEKDKLGCKDSVSDLLNKFKKARIERTEVSDDDSNIDKLNHFNWAKQPNYFTEIIKQKIK